MAFLEDPFGFNTPTYVYDNSLKSDFKDFHEFDIALKNAPINYDHKPKRGLEHFLETFADKKALVPSQFEIKFIYNYNGSYLESQPNESENTLELLACYAQDINIPSLRQNFTEIYYNGQSIELPQSYEYEHDFSMTVLNDWNGEIYEKFILMLKTFGGASTTNSHLDLEIKTVGETNLGKSLPTLAQDYSETKGLKIRLKGVRFKTISTLNFSYSDQGISTFSANLGALYFEVNDEKIKLNDMTMFEGFNNIKANPYAPL